MADDLKNISIYKLNEWGLLNKYLDTSSNDDEQFHVGNINWYRVYGEERTPNGVVGYTLKYLAGLPVKITLDYVMTEDNIKRNYPIRLVSMPCNYGGKRWFFTCPIQSNGKYCGRRVAKLYLYSTYFCCRHCLNLTYSVNNESKKYREFSSLLGTLHTEKIQERLNKTNRYYYAGKPTKNYQKVMHAYGKPTPLNYIQRLVQGIL